jgi:peptidoglycan/LPS O-acetylase OafA/YrhL
MPITTTRRVLWISLLLLAPLPFYGQHWGWVPVARVLQIIAGMLSSELVFKADGEAINLLLLLLQALFWLCFLAGAAVVYGKWSRTWPDKIRGSIMGLLVFTALLIFSSVRIYSSLLAPPQHLTFLQLYHQTVALH